jgi:integrase
VIGEHLADHGTSEDGYLYRGRRHPLVTRRTYQEDFARAAATAGLPPQFIPHSLRHYFASTAQMGRIASGASFGSLREHVLPAAQRATLRLRQRSAPPDGRDDQGLHGAPRSSATMMYLIPLRCAQLGCAC